MLDYFEQLGTLAEALELVTQPHEIVDRPDAKPLVVRRGAIRFENVCFAPSRRLSGVRGFQPRHPAGREGRPGRPVGRRQVDAGEAAAPAVRAAGRAHPHRRPGHRAGHLGFAQRGDRRSAADARRLPPRRARQHPLRQAAAPRKRWSSAARQDAHAHDFIAERDDRLRHDRRRAGHQALGRRAPARRHRARAGQGRAHPGAGRGDLSLDSEIRASDPGGAVGR